MLSTQLTGDEAPLVAEWIEYDRSFDSTGHRIRAQSVRTLRHPTTHAFRSADPDLLTAKGYVVAEGGAVTYYAPDVDVLLSEQFAATHCFHLERSPIDHPNSIGVAFQPISWFTKQQYPSTAADAAAAAAGPHSRVFANEAYADWLVFEHPQLAGRIAYDSRFELLTSRQLGSVTEFRNRVDGWRSTIRGYSVLVLNRDDDAQPIKALLRAKEARVVLRRGSVVVLRR